MTFADIDVTNGMAERGECDVLKVSYAVLPWVLDEYALLPCGGALGRGCGPLVLTRDGGKAADLTGTTIAVPSERSTAYLLFRLWAAAEVPGGVGRIVVLPFHEIMPAVRDGKVDAGLVIHEARFTYRDYGLHRLADMGEHWESTTGLPIPLGAIIARRSLGEPTLPSARRRRPRSRSAPPGTTRRRPATTCWRTPRRWTRPSPTSTSGCTSTSSPRTWARTATRRSADCSTRAAAEGLVPPLGRTRWLPEAPPDRPLAVLSPGLRRPTGRRPPAAAPAILRPWASPGSARAAATGRPSSSSVVRSCTIGSQFVRLAALRGGDRGGRVQHGHRQRLVAALAGDDAELHPLAGLERLHAGGEHRGVHEDVAAVVAGEKAEALLAVEPLDLAGGHVRPRPRRLRVS